MKFLKNRSNVVRVIKHANIGEGHLDKPEIVTDKDDTIPKDEKPEQLEVPKYKFLKYIPVALWVLALFSGIQQNLVLAIGIIIIQIIFTIVYFLDKAILVDERYKWQSTLMELNIVITMITILFGIFIRYKGWSMYKEALMRARAKLQV